MKPPRLSHVFVFTSDLERMIAFYEGALDLQRQPSEDADFVVLAASTGPGVALHQVPPHIAATISIGSPPAWRDDTALKFCFETDDLAAQRAAILEHGGQAKAPWSWRGTEFCECTDPEGNVIQILRRP